VAARHWNGALRAGAQMLGCIMRTDLLLLAVGATAGGVAAGAPAQPAAPVDTFAQLQTLSGNWEADLPGFGKIQDTVRLISNGTAIEETIGTAADNEASVYTRDGDRVLMTHYCAMTAGGHQVRLQASPLPGTADHVDFVLVGSTNLHDPSAPHMRLMSMTLVDRDHFSERWTKTEAGKDTVFELSFTRR
jgi:hypothetical protein